MISSDRTSILPVDLTGIPVELRDRRQWVIWRLEWDDERGDWSKNPYQSRSPRRKAKANVSGTWSTFEDAVATYNRDGFSGVGFVFSRSDQYVGVDLDDAIQEDRTLAEWAAEIVSRFDTYTEVSPSGTGLKLWCEGELPIEKTGSRANVRQAGEVIGEIETYHHGRYFAMTGRRWAGTRETVEPRQEAIDWLWAKHDFSAKKESTKQGSKAHNGATLEDGTLLEKIRKSKQGQKFIPLWAGDSSAYSFDDSRADQAMCNILEFWCGPDPDRIDRVFRQSGLMRDKWDRKDYRNDTIAKAIEGCNGQFYDSRNGHAGGNHHGNGSGGRPEVLVLHDEHVTSDQALELLANDTSLFHRGGNLVHIVRTSEEQRGLVRAEGTPSIAQISEKTQQTQQNL